MSRPRALVLAVAWLCAGCPGGPGDSCSSAEDCRQSLTCDPVTRTCLDPDTLVVCGDGVIEGLETCEGTDLGGATCVDGGFVGGVLSCVVCRLSFNDCHSCGDGARDFEELCDGADTDGEDCVSVDATFSGGVLGCVETCDAFDTSGCALCGDGVRTDPEPCEGGDLGGADCVDEGFGGGTLACFGGCAFDTVACDPCGNDLREGPELCDGTDLGGADCTTLGQGWAGGALACAATGCSAFVTAGCTPPVGCGNGVAAGGEQCDGADLGGASCLTLGFGGGTLACFGGCAFDPAACSDSRRDLNGDGRDDLVVGAWRDDAGGTDAGRAWAFLGAPAGTLDAVADATFDGPGTNANFGLAVALAGDLNGDGYDDVVVGAPATPEVRVYFGSPGGIDATADGVLTSGAGGFGTYLAAAGDVDGDGLDDLLVGAPADDTVATDAGAAFLFLGGAGAAFEPTADASLYGEAANDLFGTVAGAGDFDDDGLDDVLVGAYLFDDGGSLFVNRGAVYVFRGGAGAFDTVADATLIGTPGDTFGYDVAFAGDVNGDGFDDVLAGTWHDTATAGEAYLYFGGVGPGLDTTVDLTYASPLGTGDAFGRSVDGAGDVNGDGFDDVVIGAYATPAFTGAAFVFLGGATGMIDATADATITGASAGVVMGWDVSGAGDVDRDGFDDVIVGAYGASSVFLFLGGAGATFDATEDLTFTMGMGDDFGYAID